MKKEEPTLYGLLSGSADPLEYVGYRTYSTRIRPALNAPEARVLTDNKWVFYQFAQGFGLPVPRTFALYDPTFGITANGDPCTTSDELLELLDTVRPAELVIKPSGGIKGRDLFIFDCIDCQSGTANLLGCGVIDLATFIDALPRVQLRSASSGYVVQERVIQHPVLDKINPHTANTIRLVTHVTSGDDVKIPFALARFGREGKAADNWAQGGVAVAIDVETGRMGLGLMKSKYDPKYGGQWIAHHPDTGQFFRGRDVPEWADVVALCTEAARTFPGVRSIGWDILVTPSGPVLLEANEEWSLVMAQTTGGGWLAHQWVHEEFRQLGIDYPKRIPSSTVAAWTLCRCWLMNRLRRLALKFAYQCFIIS